MEYVEVRGKTVDVAVEAALEELGIERDRADIEVIQEPEKGFLGMGGKDAVVRVKARPAQKRRRRRRRGERGDEGRPGDKAGSPPVGADRGARGERRSESRSRNSGRSDRSGSGRDRETRNGAALGGSGRQNGSRNNDKPQKEATEVSIEEQTPVVESFLKGLVEAFGLDGTVTVTTDDDVIVAEVSGPQTEAMVGPRGSTIEAIHELTKTVLQRQTQASARVRLDIAGYAERRRQALAIYADQLIDQVLAEGGEVMLEPMSAGDRKTIHDAVAPREGVRSYSEGEAPQRFVVIASSGSDFEEE
ncbi:MAG TPA: RNA-binding cell elongation regulator Jag/EloR [Acidimicrobiia bacterium]|nr:RNA-binding cell elongation regulator Jag/EloR [Acidimicrobiia bacterium]